MTISDFDETLKCNKFGVKPFLKQFFKKNEVYVLVFTCHFEPKLQSLHGNSWSCFTLDYYTFGWYNQHHRKSVC